MEPSSPDTNRASKRRKIQQASSSSGMSEYGEAMDVDEGINSRMPLASGPVFPTRDAANNILISGIGGLGLETARQIILQGAFKAITLHDMSVCKASDVNLTQPYVSTADVGEKRAVVYARYLTQLNSDVNVYASPDELTVELLKTFRVVILTDSDPEEQLRIAEIVREFGNTLIVARTRGLFAQVFYASGRNFTIVGENPSFVISSWSKGPAAQLHLAFKAMDVYFKKHGRLPKPWSPTDSDTFFRIARHINSKIAGGPTKVEVDFDLLTTFAHVCQGVLHPIDVAIGDIVAQVAMNALSGKLTSITRWQYFDATECLPEDRSLLTEDQCKPTGSCYDGQIAIFGSEFLLGNLIAAALCKINCNESDLLPAELVIQSSQHISKIYSHLENRSVMEMAFHLSRSKALLLLLRSAAACPTVVPLLLSSDVSVGGVTYRSQSIYCLLRKLCNSFTKFSACLSLILNQIQGASVAAQADDPYDLEKGIEDLSEDFRVTLTAVKAVVLDHTGRGDEESEEHYSNSQKEDGTVAPYKLYCDVMQPLQFQFSSSQAQSSATYESASMDEWNRMKRLALEVASLATSLALNPQSSIFVRCDPDQLRTIKVMITGPEGSPYANGCFLLTMVSPPDFPKSPFNVNLDTTGGGRLKLGLTLPDGTVKMVNSWAKGDGIKWDETTTLHDLLSTIRDNIFTNKSSTNDRDVNNRIATIRWAMLEQLDHPPPAFKEAILSHFSLRKEEIIKQCEDWINEMERLLEKNPDVSNSLSEGIDKLKRHYHLLKAKFDELVAPDSLSGRSTAYSSERPMEVDATVVLPDDQVAANTMFSLSGDPGEMGITMDDLPEEMQRFLIKNYLGLKDCVYYAFTSGSEKFTACFLDFWNNKLILSGCYHLTSCDYDRFFRTPRSQLITYMDASHLYWLQPETILGAISTMINLEQLSIQGTQLTVQHLLLFFKSCKTVKKLSFTLTEDSLFPFESNETSLAVLKEGFGRLTDLKILRVNRSETCSMKSWPVTLAALSWCSSCRDLRIEVAYPLIDETPEGEAQNGAILEACRLYKPQLEWLKNLESLVITKRGNNPHVADLFTHELHNWLLVNGELPPSLKRLWVQEEDEPAPIRGLRLDNISASSVSALCLFDQDEIHLDLGHATFNETQSVAGIRFSALASMSKLKFAQGHCVDGVGLGSFCENHPELEHLYFNTGFLGDEQEDHQADVHHEDVHQEGDHHLQGGDYQIGDGEWRLLKLKTVGYLSTSPREAVVDKLINDCPNVEVLYLGSEMPPEGLVVFPDGYDLNFLNRIRFWNLSTLHLERFHMFAGEFLIPIMQQCPKMRTFHVNNPYMEAGFLSNLGECLHHAKNLRNLRVQWDNQDTEVAINTFLERVRSTAPLLEKLVVYSSGTSEYQALELENTIRTLSSSLGKLVLLCIAGFYLDQDVLDNISASLRSEVTPLRPSFILHLGTDLPSVCDRTLPWGHSDGIVNPIDWFTTPPDF